jgi:ribonuclease D
LYIRDENGLVEAVEVLAGSRVLALDTEFMRERTYFARLCLIQMATDTHTFLIDTLALDGHLSALAPLLADPATLKVFHAGSQDIEILIRATGVAPQPVFDTQVAATLAGFPSQVGYAQLVKETLGVNVDKADTFTDWSVRPLTDAQLAYAAADVEYLPGVYELLRERLEREGRLSWLAEDFEKMADPAFYRIEPREQYRRVKRASTLDRRSLAVLRELAAWREDEAQRRDLPKRWLLSDESLIEIARRRPRDAGAIGAIRGVNERVASRNGAAILEAIRRGEAVPDEELPRLPKRARIPTDAQPIADLLAGILRLRAREHGVAAGLFASRDELERFAAGERDGHPLSSGWRHTLVGAELEAVIEGRLGVRVTDGRILVEPVASGVKEDEPHGDA